LKLAFGDLDILDDAIDVGELKTTMMPPGVSFGES